MHTKDKLALEIEKADLPPEMAARARAGHYHDFLSDLPDPAMELDRDLVAAMKQGFDGAVDLRRRHHDGEFDASFEESEEWARGRDGQEAFARLARGE